MLEPAKPKHNARSRSCFGFQLGKPSLRKLSSGNSTDRSVALCTITSRPENSTSFSLEAASFTERNNFSLTVGTTYSGLLPHKGLPVIPDYGPVSKLFKFPIYDTRKRDSLIVKKDRLNISNWINVKEVLKNYHKNSPFKGTHALTSPTIEEKENLRTNILKENTITSENVKTIDSAEKPYTRDSKAEGIRYHINPSLVNKNINYSQKTFELQKDTGEYQHTTFENLRTEYFLLNPNGISNTVEDMGLLKVKMDDTIVEQELQNIYRKIRLANSKEGKFIEEPNEMCCLEEEDPIPHMVHNSDLTASKNVWKRRVSPRGGIINRTTQFEAKFWDLRIPLARKLLICKHMGTENKISLEHGLVATGYLATPQLVHSTSTICQVDTTDKALPLNSILSSQILSSMSQTKVSLITCGFEHCTVLTQTGSVASWGYGGSGCLGHGNYTTYTSPKLIKGLPTNVVHIESGAYHSAAVCLNGDLYVWGRSDVGQLGVSTRKLQRDTKGWVALSPQLVESFKGEVRRVAAGEAHTIVLGKEGKIYTAGWGQHGQLGQGVGTEIAFEFKPVMNATKIVSIGAGSLFSAAVDSQGKVYTWGSNEQGQLGIKTDKPKEKYVPKKVKLPNKELAAEVCCGEAVVMVYCKSGKVYGWGQGYYEMNGIERKESNRNIPQLVNKFDPCQYWVIKCPKELSFIVSFAC